MKEGLRVIFLGRIEMKKVLYRIEINKIITLKIT